MIEEAESENQVLDKELLEQEGIYYDEEQNLYFDMMTGKEIDMQFIEERLKNLEGEDAETTIVQRETIETKPSDTTSLAPT